MKRKSYVKIISFILILAISLPVAALAEDDKPSDEIWGVFSEDSSFRGMKAWYGTGEAAPVVSRDPVGWTLQFKSGNYYIHVDIDDRLMYDLNGEAIEIEVDYYDKGAGVFTLNYDGFERKDTDAEYVDLTNTGEWKTHTFFIQDAVFKNGLDNSDFRISVTSPFLKSWNSSYEERDNIVFGAVRVKRAEVKSPIHIDITSEAVGNIFFEDEKVKMTVDYTNKCKNAYKLNALVQAVDINNVVRWENREELNFEPEEKKSVTYEFDIDKFNLYWLRVTLSDNEEKIFCINDAEFFYVTTNHGTRLNYDAGTTPHLENYNRNGDYTKILPLMQKAGYGRHRFAINWTHLYSGSGGFGLPPYFEDVLKAVKEHGFENTIIVSKSHNRYPYKGSSVPAYNSGPPTAEFLEDYAEYIRELVRLTRDYADSYIIGNEDELNDVVTAESYVQWAEVAYTEIKKAYPEAKVLGYGLTLYDKDWFLDNLRLGTNDFYDMASVHPYAMTATAEASRFLERIQNFWNLAKDELGIEMEPAWIGEIGHFHVRHGGLSAHEISQQFPRYYIYASASGIVDKLIDYMMTNTSPVSYGHIRGTNEYSNYDINVPYAPYREYLTIACWNKNFGGDCDFVENIDTQNTRLYHFKRRTDGKDFAALWSLTGRENVTLDLGTNEISYMDILGNEEKMYSDDGRYTFNLSQDVNYIIGNFNKFEVSDKPKYDFGALSRDVVKGSPEEISVSINGVKSEGYTISTTDYMKAETLYNSKDNDALCLGVTVGSLSDGYTEKFLCGNAGRSQYKLNDASDIRDIVSVDVKKDGKLYARCEIPLKEMDPIKITVDLSPASGDDASRWQTGFAVENRSAEEVSGTFRVTAPAEIAAISEPVAMTIRGKDVSEVTYPLPASLLGQGITFKAEFTPSNGETVEFMNKMDSLCAIYTDTPPTIDGSVDSSEWILSVGGKISETSWEHLIETETYTGADDLSGTVNMMWDKENLYLTVGVKDNVHKQAYTAGGTWKADGLQVGFTAGDKPSNWTALRLAMNDDGSIQKYLASSEDGTIKAGVISDELMDLAVKREKDITTYEMRISWKMIMPHLNILNFGDGANVEGVEIYDESIKEAKSGESFRFSVLVNDDDGGGRKGYAEYGTGVSAGAYRSFSSITLFGGKD